MSGDIVRVTGPIMLCEGADFQWGYDCATFLKRKREFHCTFRD